MIIQNDTELRRFIPNTLVTVEGEATLFDKMQPDLHLSELWLTNLLGDLASLMPTSNNDPQSPAEPSINPSNQDATVPPSPAEPIPIRELLLKILATDAFLRTLPSLDLILTPNGFGIVSNSTIAPASKDRIDRLIVALENSRDFALDQALNRLLKSETWRATEPAQFFLQTLFQTPFALPAEVRQIHAWQTFQDTHPQLVAIEAELADKFISQEVYQRLRTDCENPIFARLIQPLRTIEIDLLQGRPLPYTKLVAIVDYIRKHEDIFPEWQTSDTAKLYTPHAFQNDKKSGGYFF